MVNKRVLIVFSSTYGHIAEIAHEISKTLEEKGLAVDVTDLGRTRRNRWPNIDQYDGILAGSCSGNTISYGLQIDGKQTLKRELRNFFNMNIQEIIQKNKFLGVFRSNPFDIDVIINPEPADAFFEQVLINKYGFKPPMCAVFGPVVDFSRSTKLKYETRVDLRRKVKVLSKHTGIVFDMRGYNDFRDWDRIHNFSIEFAERLDSSLIPSTPGNHCPNCGGKIESTWKFCVNCMHKLQ
jgi:menaquinone-dependent protoporphyrinogen IX oxidase